MRCFNSYFFFAGRKWIPRIFISVGFLMSASLVGYADSKIVINGSSKEVIEVIPEPSTGLNNIFVVYDIQGVSINYRTSNPNCHAYTFSNIGGAYAEEVRNTSYNNGEFIINVNEGNCGYIIEDNDYRYYYWIVNYSNYLFSIYDVSVSSMSDCSSTILDIEGSGGEIHYFTINGQQKILSREIEISYTTQEFDSEAQEYVQVDSRKIVDSISSQVRITPSVYCSTPFRISGDRFLKSWGLECSAESIVYNPIAVDCSTSAVQTQTSEDNSNKIKSDEGILGGSAPAEITFTAYVTEAVIHDEWQLGRDPTLENPEYRFTNRELQYTFHEEGTFYLRYIGSNYDGSCETESDIYTVTIGASELLCPNAFSPNDDGINDIWKVSYRSIIDFHCWIFDRNGQQLYSFDSPDGGWDGKVGGKTVHPGVYYYVIQATGADGKTYKKSGDINIIRSNSSTNSYNNNY